MPTEHLGPEAAELLSLTNAGEARSLNGLAELAAWQVPACAGAHAAVWDDGEVAAQAATHPDLAELADLQLSTGCGPLVAAADAGVPVSCPDLLDEARWPEPREPRAPKAQTVPRGRVPPEPGLHPIRSGGAFTFATRMVMSSRSSSWEKAETRPWTIRAVSAAERPASPASSSARLSSK